MSDPKFPTQEAYFAWCAGVCQRIKTNSIAMNNAGIREAIHDIHDMLYTTGHQELFGPTRIAELESIVCDFLTRVSNNGVIGLVDDSDLVDRATNAAQQADGGGK